MTILAAEQTSIDQLRPWQDNPRSITQAAFAALKRSMQADPLMLEARPLLALPDGTVFAGNMRLQAAIELGLPTLPVIRVDIDQTRASEWALRDNNQYGDWDDQALAELLTQLRDDGSNIMLLGFPDAELDRLLDSVGALGDTPYTLDGRPSLADRFLIPPLSVLDARSGAWRERKKQWLSLGIRSEQGRSTSVYTTPQSRDPGFFAAKNAAARRLGRELTTAEFAADHWAGVKDTSSLSADGTSVFDPVLTELACRWYAPPGGAVLDPFAGGSVRGLVCSLLGYPYTGIDLSPDQIAANNDQALLVLNQPSLAPTDPRQTSDPDQLTPIDEHAGIYYKRDDLFAVNGAIGGKARACLHLSQGEEHGLVTAGSRTSPQVNIVARIAQHLGIPSSVHTPEGEPGPEVRDAQKHGAELHQHQAGRNSVIIARARTDAKERGWRLIPFGMDHPDAIHPTSLQAANLPVDAKRIVVAVGSGITAAGILTGLRALGRTTPILGVVVGADPTKRLDHSAPGWRSQLTLIPSGTAYDQPVEARLPDGTPLDAHYEAKAAEHLQEGDCLWIVGIRPSAADTQTTPPPTWIEGDALEQLSQMESDSFDLLHTCPPYYDLERYSDDARDLSTMSPADFDHTYTKILNEAARLLRPDSFAVIIVGDVRHPGGLRSLVSVTDQAMRQAGCEPADHNILVHPVGAAALRAAKHMNQGRVLERCHQYVLTYCKGDRNRAAARLGEISLADPDPDPDSLLDE